MNSRIIALAAAGLMAACGHAVGQCITPSFSAPGVTPAPTFPAWLGTEDVNRDGRADLLVTSQAAGQLWVRLGNGNGTFQAATTYTTGGGARWVGTGDFNGDTWVDLAVANTDVNTVSILLNNQAGGFTPGVTLASSSYPRAVCVADLNNDGKNDIAVANEFSGNVSVFLGNGDGTFQPRTTWGVGNSPRCVAAADFNRDGRLDLAVANSGSTFASVLLGDGAGGFQPALNVGSFSNGFNLVARDFDRDGIVDLAVASFASNTVTVLRNNGSAAFSTWASAACGVQPNSLVAGDFNDDGVLDLAVANEAANTVSVVPGTGTGFGSRIIASGVTTPIYMAAADFNNDRRLDLIAVSSVASGATLRWTNSTSGGIIVTSAPIDQHVALGAPFTLSVGATTAGSTLSYQWFRGATPLQAAPGAFPVLSVAAASASDAGPYTCVVTNSAGCTRSLGAGVEVSSPCSTDSAWTPRIRSPRYTDMLSRSSVVGAFSPAQGKVIMFGGYLYTSPTSGQYTNETWAWDGAAWSQLAATGPAPRRSASIATDWGRGTVLLFGGIGSGSTLFRDTWEWNGSRWTLVSNTGPAADWSAPMAYDQRRRRMVLVTRESNVMKTWEWDGANWSLRSSGDFSSRPVGAMAYDAVRGECIFYGGYGPLPGGGFGFLNETWAWNGTSWSQRAASGPGGRLYHSMTWDSWRGEIVLLGGGGTAPDPDQYFTDCWTWNGSAWTLDSAAHPGKRETCVAAFDPVRGTTVVAAGTYISGGFTRIPADTWVRGPAAPTADAIAPLDPVCPGTTVSIPLNAYGSEPLGFQWRLDGAPIDTMSNPTAATPTLTLLADQVGSFDCVITNDCGSLTTPAVQLAVRTQDFNQDGVADQGDVDYLIDVIAGGANPTNADPDLNGDGNADQADVDALINWIAGGECP